MKAGKVLLLNALVTLLTIAACYAAYQEYVLWSRVNAMWVWVNAQARAEMAAQAKMAPMAPTPTPKSGT